MEKRDFADMVIFFCQKVSEMNISRKHKMELLGMITAIEMKHDELMPKWIPVSEALPKVRTDVLLAFEKNMAVGFYSHDCWNVNTGNGFYTGVFTDEDKPIAWMPLVEPYKEGE